MKGSFIWDMLMLVGDLALILLFFWFVLEAGKTYMEYFALADARIIQEHFSGFLSASNYAPRNFNATEHFPPAPHSLRILTSPPRIEIEVGSFFAMPKMKFREAGPITYVKYNRINILGDCVDAWCAFTQNGLNKINIQKNETNVTIALEHVED